MISNPISIMFFSKKKKSDIHSRIASFLALAIILASVGLTAATTDMEDLQGRFNWNRSDFVTRGELAQVTAYHFGIMDECPMGTPQTFPDVPDLHPFFCGIEMVNQYEIMQGIGSGNFEPEGFVTRAEAAQIFFRGVNPPVVTPSIPSFTDVDPGLWYYEAIESLNAYGLFNTTELFNPNNSLRWNAFAGWLLNL